MMRIPPLNLDVEMTVTPGLQQWAITLLYESWREGGWPVALVIRTMSERFGLSETDIAAAILRERKERGDRHGTRHGSFFRKA